MKVKIISSPVTERYVRKGMVGHLDNENILANDQIQVNGVWFGFNAKWKVKEIKK